MKPDTFINRVKLMVLGNEPTLLRSIDGYIPAVNTARFLKGKKRILIVGDAGGRDWMYLTSLGKEIHIVDISPQTNFPNLVVQSIENRTPFPDQFFDGVVMNEVLEHLFHDVAALEEIRRVLKTDGVLIITVPYYSNVQDNPEFHVRIHSYKTMQRLLENTGFEIQEHFYRGFCSRLPQLSFLINGMIFLIQKIARWSLKKTPAEAVDLINGPFEKLEKFLGSHPFTARFQKLFASYGGILCAKIGNKKDFYQVQTDHFSSNSCLN